MSQNSTPDTTPERIILRPAGEVFTITCGDNEGLDGVIAIPADSAAPVGSKEKVCQEISQATIESTTPGSFNCLLEDGQPASARLEFTPSLESIGEICVAVSMPEGRASQEGYDITASEVGGGLIVGAVMVAAAVRIIRSW